MKNKAIQSALLALLLLFVFPFPFPALASTTMVEPFETIVDRMAEPSSPIAVITKKGEHLNSSKSQNAHEIFWTVYSTDPQKRILFEAKNDAELNAYLNSASTTDALKIQLLVYSTDGDVAKARAIFLPDVTPTPRASLKIGKKIYDCLVSSTCRNKVSGYIGKSITNTLYWARDTIKNIYDKSGIVRFLVGTGLSEAVSNYVSNIFCWLFGC